MMWPYRTRRNGRLETGSVIGVLRVGRPMLLVPDGVAREALHTTSVREITNHDDVLLLVHTKTRIYEVYVDGAAHTLGE